jgi:hypothetical protein
MNGGLRTRSRSEMPSPTIPFEIHITTVPLAEAQLEPFVALCRQHGGKPLLIELARGEHAQQPMFSKVVYAAGLPEALAATASYGYHLQREGFPATRLKLEVPAHCAALLAGKVDRPTTPYFEWHGKIVIERAEALAALCRRHGVHLSRNALKGEGGTRFVTLREFGPQRAFGERVDVLVRALGAGGWPVANAQAEYCVFDTNTSLDKGWLPQR